MEEYKFGDYILKLPPTGERKQPILAVGPFDYQRMPLLEIELPWGVVVAISQWNQNNSRLEDIDNYIESVESGDEKPISGMTANKLKEARMELLDYYGDRLGDSDDWYFRLRQAVQGYEWDHRVTKTYWKCPIDQYGQRNGDVQEVHLAEWQYEEMRKHEFLYDDYATALAAAQD